jgi:hypothetical protein
MLPSLWLLPDRPRRKSHRSTSYDGYTIQRYVRYRRFRPCTIRRGSWFASRVYRREAEEVVRRFRADTADGACAEAVS